MSDNSTLLQLILSSANALSFVYNFLSDGRGIDTVLPSRDFAHMRSTSVFCKRLARVVCASSVFCVSYVSRALHLIY